MHTLASRLSLVLVLSALWGLSQARDLSPHLQILSSDGLSHVTLSPDGRQAAWVDRDGERLEVRRGELDRSESGRTLLRTQDHVPRGLWWFRDGILFHSDRLGGGAALWAIPSEGPVGRAVLELEPGVLLSVLGAAGNGQALIAHDRRKSGAPDVFRLDLRTGESQLEVRNPGRIFQWLVDREGKVRGARRWQPAGASIRYEILHRARATGRFQVIAAHDLVEPEVLPLGFHPQGYGLYVQRESRTGEHALHLLDPVSRSFGKTLHNAGAASIGQLRHDPASLALALIGLEGQQPSLHATLPDWQRWAARLSALRPGARLEWIGRDSRQRSLWKASSPQEPGEYLRLDEQGELRILARTGQVPRDLLSPVEGFRFTARDGLSIPGYVTRAGSATGPAVILVHGGPWSRDRWAFHPQAQFLASLGYVVLQANFRGSRGLGHELLQAGRGQWGQGMQQDLVDLVQWAGRQGWIDPRRVCLMGSSYGGYAALMGVILDSEVFRCAVSHAPVTDLVTQISQYREDQPRAFREWGVMVGEPDRSSDRLTRISPLHHAADLRRPVLLSHGDRDHIVTLEHSERFADQAAPDLLEVLWFEGEGHTLHGSVSRDRYYRAVARFLARHLAQ